jgi:putative colanic acid biosynthesis UDP-glucose lipid carrier transferase
MFTSTRAIRASWSPFQALYRLADAGAILLGLAAAGGFLSPNWATPLLVGGALAAFFFASEVTGLYRDWRGVSSERELLCALFTWSGALALAFAVDHFFRRGEALPWNAAFVWLLTTPLAAIAVRILVRSAQRVLRARGYNTRSFAIVGLNDLGIQLAENIEASPELGLVLRGFFDDRPAERVAEAPAHVGQRLGNLDDLVALAKRREVDIIYITFPMRAEDRIRRVLERLGDSTASVYIVPDFFVFELLHSRWTSINGLPVVSVFETPFYGVDGLVKRMADVVLAAVILIALAVPMAVIACLVKASSPGPVFFRQRRYGLDGREILVWKFRSMRVCENGAKVDQATRNDPRVTRIGAILRKTSLDELPQLFNVLQGDMSLVGPRPHASAHNEQYRQRINGYMLRHKVKPGITGLAQVNGWRGETDTLEKMEKRVEFDHRYIREWSLWLDLKILLRTVLVVLSRQNAY